MSFKLELDIDLFAQIQLGCVETLKPNRHLTPSLEEKIFINTFVVYNKYDRKRKLWTKALVAGWEDFDWQKAHDLGWFCPNDYKIFTELKELKNGN